MITNLCSIVLVTSCGLSQTVINARTRVDCLDGICLSDHFCTTPGVLNETCVQNAISSGVHVRVTAGTYTATHTVLIDRSHSLVEFDPGVVWNFEPKGLISRANNNDRAFLLHNDEGFSEPHLIAGEIPIGSGSFISANRNDTSNLADGDWLLVQETDPGLGEIIAIDWVQVESVSSGARGDHCIIRVQRPFRTAFLNNHTPPTLSFRKISNYVHDVSLKCNGAVIQSSQTKTGTPGIAVGVVRGALVDGCVVSMANGQALYSYRGAAVVFRNNRVIRSGSATSEFAATVDLSLDGNSFGNEGPANDNALKNDSSALSIDFGSAFFNVIGNRFISGSDIMMEILYGVHDGVISGNVWSWTGTSGLSVGQGVSAIGSQRILFAGNVLDGGSAGVGNTGIAFASFHMDGLGSQPIASEGNLISNNIVNNYANKYGRLLPGDSYVDLMGENRFSSLATPANGSILYCSDCTVVMPASCMNVSNVEACACKGGGSGALAKRINGSWLCN
jgi:hypothetical protein